MPINLARDTRLALREFAGACECRSLLQQRLVFCETDLDAARRLALDLWLDEGRADVVALGTQATTDAERRERWHGKSDPDARKLRSLQSLSERMAKDHPRWKSRQPQRHWLGESQPGRRCFRLVTRQPLAVGLANAAWENAGLSLHRRFGYPLIPGSALKGLALRGALDLQADSDLRRLVLGDGPDTQSDSSRRAGAVAFLDAVAEASVIQLDIVTPHYSDYYSESARKPNPHALDTEQPKPNVFPVVAPGARFRFDLLLLPYRDRGQFTADTLLAAAQQWLTHALNVFGAGAKSRAGYGRFGDLSATGDAHTLFPETAAAAPFHAKLEDVVLSPAEACLARWRDKVPTFAFSMPPFVTELAALSDEDLRRVARALIRPSHWHSTGLPANPTANPFWLELSKVPGGADLLRRLCQPKS